MRLLINIPKEFEQHFQADRFEDSLHRLSADAHLLAGNYEQETAVMLIESFKNAVPVPLHGRLIDADFKDMTDYNELKKKLRNRKQDCHGCSFENDCDCENHLCNQAADAIEELVARLDAPTIIPADKEGE